VTRLPRRLGGLSVALLVALASLGVAAAPVAAADPVEFGTPTADSTYGQSIEFHQPVTLAAAPSRVELLITTPGAAGPGVTEVDAPTRGGDQTLNFALELADGHIVPNTSFTAQWRVTDADGTTWLGPPISETYSDTRVDWKTLEGDVVRVHWYDGSDDFGRRALQIGDEAVKQTSELLGVTETEPIDFFIYADQDKFYDALGPATRENVGGEAHADIRTMSALITPNEINDSWVSIVVPHELTHLVFDTATKNPYHEPPHWLNEGLAVYLSEGYGSDFRNQTEDAARNGTIMPLDGLVGAFPTTRDRFFLAYAESVSAVDWIVANKGRDALIGLIRSYADGVSDDEAFTNALGMDTEAFQQAWLAGLGATAPVRHGPQPAPVGPLPEGWSGAAPNPSVAPGSSGAPGDGGNAPIFGGSSGSGLPLPVLIGVIGLLLVAVVGGLLLFDRRRRSAVAPPPDSSWTSPAAPPPMSTWPDQVPPADPPAPAAAEAPDPWGATPPDPAPAESPEPRPPAPPEP
jgi:hypothetical protein